MSEALRHAWRRAALVGAVFAVAATVALVVSAIIGMNDAYLEQARVTGRVAPLFDDHSGPMFYAQAVMYALLFPLPFLISALFWGFVREALIPPQMVFLRHLAQFGVGWLFVVGALHGVIAHYAEFHLADDAQRAQWILLGIVFVKGFGFGVYSVGIVCFLGSWRARALPKRLIALFLAFDVVLLLQDFYGLAPDKLGEMSVFGSAFGGMQMVLLSVILWLGSHPPRPDDTPRL